MCRVRSSEEAGSNEKEKQAIINMSVRSSSRNAIYFIFIFFFARVKSHGRFSGKQRDSEA